MTDKKKSFILYADYQKHVARLSDTEAGQLFKAILEYTSTGERPGLSPMVEMAFSFIAEQLDRDAEKWRDICKKRSEAGRKGAEKTNLRNSANAAFAAAKTADNETVDETENATETVTDTVSENENVNAAADVSVGETEAVTASRRPRSQKISLGKYRNVSMTKDDYSALTEEFGRSLVDDYIDRVDSWVQMKGRDPYSDYAAAVRSWIKKDGADAQPRPEDIGARYACVIDRF